MHTSRHAATGEGPVLSGAALTAPDAQVTLLRHFDLVALVAALPLFVLAGLPLMAYGAAGAAWLAQRAIKTVLDRRAAAADDPRTVAGVAVASMLARGWLVTLTIFAVGLSDNDAGLAAAVLTILLFTIHFTFSMIFRPLGGREGRAR